jgi:hypothetical protein
MMRVDEQQLVQALRSLPTPEPRLGFVDRAIRNAVASGRQTSLFAHIVSCWETWVGVAAGAAAATLLTLGLSRSPASSASDPIALSINEVRNIDVVIDSERELSNATIRVAVIGGIEFEGFENERQLDWTADLRRGANLLTLPVLARSSGNGVLIAMIEHGGEQRSVTVNVRVHEAGSSKS